MKEETNIVADMKAVLERLHRMEKVYELIKSRVARLEKLISIRTKEKLTKLK